MNELVDRLNAIIALVRDYPALLMILFSSPLFLLAVAKRVYPRLPLVCLAGIPCALSFGLLLWPAAFGVVVVADVTIVIIAVVDLLNLPKVGLILVERRMGRIVSLNVKHLVTLIVDNRSSNRRLVWIRDEQLPGFEAEPSELFLDLMPWGRSIVQYNMKATRRGAFTLTVVHLRLVSRLRFWQKFLNAPAHSDVHVFPDMQQLSEYAVLARTNRLSLMGVHTTRKIGQDNEFERLRDYTVDDNYKHIDWRSTARRNKLTVKDFQTNQAQRLIFMLDCGRMMTNEAAGLSLLDHSLNAMLMLSYVALRQGDSVGLICFSDVIHSFVPPGGGMNQMNRILHASFDRFPRIVESRYDQAFLYLASHCRKRSLVTLITNVIDEVNANQIQRYLGNLVGRHLAIGVLLRDHRMFDPVDIPYHGDDQMFRALAAAEIVSWRHEVLTDLEHQGVLALDVFPEKLTAPLVNQYLDIKARHLL